VKVGRDQRLFTSALLHHYPTSMVSGPNSVRKSRKRARGQFPLFASGSGVDVASGHKTQRQQVSAHEGDTIRFDIPKSSRRLQHHLRDRFEVAQKGEIMEGQKDERTTNASIVETLYTSVSGSADGTPADQTVELVAAIEEDDEQEVPASAEDDKTEVKAEQPSSTTAVLDQSDTSASSNSPTIGPATGNVSSSVNIEAEAANTTSSAEDGTSSATLDSENNVSSTISPAPTQATSLATSSSRFPTDAPTIQVSSLFPTPAPTTSTSNIGPGVGGIVTPQPDETEPSGPALQPPGEDPQGGQQDEEQANSKPSPLPTPSLTEEEQDPYDRHERDWGSLELDADNDFSTIFLSPPEPEETSSPSETHSSFPSLTPSTSSAPTDEPTIENTTTFDPTTEPTAFEADLVAVMPPTVTSSSQPTKTFAPTVTFQPTVTPAPTTLLDCLTADGSYEYGKISTLTDGVTAVPVAYRYEVEFERQFDPEIVQNEIVPKLELALNEQLLPTLFDSCQLETDVIADSRRRLQTRGSPIVGISAARDDRVFDSEDCESTRNSTDRGPCTPVLGDLTIYLDEDEPMPAIEAATGAVLRLVEFAMDRDALNDVDPAIRRVVFIPALGTPSPTPQVGAERSSDSSERIRGFPAIITFAVLFLLAGLFMIYYGITRIKDDNDSQSKDESYGGYVEDREEQIQTEIEDEGIVGGNDEAADAEFLAALEYGRDDDELEQDFNDDWGTPESSTRF